MKVALIGGAGVRTPLLVNSLARSDLPVDEVALYDIDRSRLAGIADLARRASGHPRIRTCAQSADAIEGAAFVLTSIRVGGIEARSHDESAAIAHGVIGQETVGPGGFAMAVRTIPHAIRYAREAARHAPDAWIVNFTNPVGIVTQAMRLENDRVVGICDTPTELFEDVARALQLPTAECGFDYFGLNHLGWLREVSWRGAPQLSTIWERPDLLARLYRAPLFAPEFLQQLRLLPTEYLFFYYRPGDALDNLRRAGTSRGAEIARLNVQLFEALRSPGTDPVALYERYLAARNASYMQLESGAPGPLPRSPWAEATGYDKMALATIRAMHFGTGAVIPLDVPNDGNLPALEDDDVVEVPCRVDANGPRPLHVRRPPDSVGALMVQVKTCERLTLKAALSGDRADQVTALAAHPLVGDRDLADRLVADLRLA